MYILQNICIYNVVIIVSIHFIYCFNTFSFILHSSIHSFCYVFVGCTPLILAATAGHATTVEILLEHRAEIEAQSDRTKDTALSLACSGGRQEVHISCVCFK